MKDIAIPHSHESRLQAPLVPITQRVRQPNPEQDKNETKMLAPIARAVPKVSVNEVAFQFAFTLKVYEMSLTNSYVVSVRLVFTSRH